MVSEKLRYQSAEVRTVRITFAVGNAASSFCQ
jgi:hypothetical protein